MKRVALSFVVCFAAAICFAQEHMRFMDIPICGTVEQFANRLANEKGFTILERNDYEEADFKVETKMLSGTFETFTDCYVAVRKIEGASETSSVIVYIDSLKCLHGEYDKLLKQYDKRYGKRSGPSTGQAGYLGNDSWVCDGGIISTGSLERCYFVAFMNFHEAEIRHAFYTKIAEESMNNQLEKQKEGQTVREICGVPFGSSYEKARAMLENKYGTPEYYPDHSVISYKNKTYAGILFDDIIFLFQSDGIHSYMNGCAFVLDAKSLSDAKKKQELLYKVLSDKYILVENTDDNGNKIYLGGFPPTPDDHIAFSIGIMKYDGDVAKHSHPYAARLIYGRYNYVKEEF